jgi:hypothetical protein
MQRNPLTALLTLAACASLALTAATPVHAQGAKTDPSGTWTWTRPGRNGGPDQTNTLVLKLDGDKLSGSVSSPGRGGAVTKTDITDASAKDGAVAFTTTREYNGNKTVVKYSGKVSTDTIEGKTETTRNDGDPQSRDWKATRAPAQ